MLTDVSDREPSVSELADAAGINRSSFYAHFSSTADFILFILDQALMDIHSADLNRREGRTISARDATRMVLTEIVQGILSDRRLVSVIRNAPSMAQFRIAAMLRIQIVDYYAQVRAFEALDPNFLSTAADYVSGGLTTTICAWLATSMPVAQEELVNQMLALVPPWMVDPDMIPFIDVTSATR